MKVSPEQAMQRAISIAKNGQFAVQTNPLVGCVILYRGEIMGEGWHKIFGGPHAEPNAITSLKEESILHSGEAEVFVTLEPCAHYGKTPPCAELLSKYPLKKVHIAMKDPHELVAGKGIALLESKGIAVEIGLCEKEARELNPAFIKYHSTQQTYIHCKHAESANGILGNTTNELAISSPLGRQYGHMLRAKYQSILIGGTTFDIDSPTLTTREFHGNSPQPIVIDFYLKRQNSIPKHWKILHSNEVKCETDQGIPWNGEFKSLPKTLAAQGIQSCLIEGGAMVLTQCIQDKIWDSYTIIRSNTDAENSTNSVPAPQLNASIETTRLQLGKDTVIEFRPC